MRRSWKLGALATALSVGLTAFMSWLFHGTVQPEMLITGLVCAVVCYQAIARITRGYRQKLREANREKLREMGYLD